MSRILDDMIWLADGATALWAFSATVDVYGGVSPVVSRWYDLWAGLVAVDAICVSQGSNGTSFAAGEVSIRLDIDKIGGGNTIISLS